VWQSGAESDHPTASTDTRWGVALIAMGIAYIACACVLLLVSSVRAYFRRERTQLTSWNPTTVQITLRSFSPLLVRWVSLVDAWRESRHASRAGGP
jgi:hypothetical protein